VSKFTSGISICSVKTNPCLATANHPPRPHLPVIPAQAGIQRHPQRAAGACSHDRPTRLNPHGARCGTVWVPACAGTTRQVRPMPKEVWSPITLKRKGICEQADVGHLYLFFYNKTLLCHSEPPAAPLPRHSRAGGNPEASTAYSSRCVLSRPFHKAKPPRRTMWHRLGSRLRGNDK